MSTEKPTAKLIQKDLKKYQYALCHREVLPDQWVGRTHPDHGLVCWANTLTGLYISKNFDLIPMFVSRIIKGLGNSENRPVGQAYRRLLKDYCCQISYYVMNYTSADPELITNWLPEEILFSGRTDFPSDDYPEPSNDLSLYNQK